MTKKICKEIDSHRDGGDFFLRWILQVLMLEKNS